MEEAKDWERRFIGEIKAGRNPLVAPARTANVLVTENVAGLLDAYFDRYLKPAGIRSLRTAAGRLKALKHHFGELPIKALEDADVVNRFKTQSAYARKVKISTMHKALALLRAAIRWGQAQRPPLIDKSPFHRFGVRLNTKAETVRDRRIVARRGEAVARCRPLDEHLAAPLRGPADARPDRRRPRTVLPPGRDAAHPEQARGLGHPHDRHPGPHHEGQGEPPHPVRPERPPGGRAAAARRARARRVRLRDRERRVRGELQDRVGVTAAARQRPRRQAREPQGRGSTGPRSARSTCTGTTCATRGPAGCSPTAWTSASSS